MDVNLFKTNVLFIINHVSPASNKSHMKGISGSISVKWGEKILDMVLSLHNSRSKVTSVIKTLRLTLNP